MHYYGTGLLREAYGMKSSETDVDKLFNLAGNLEA